MNLFVILAVLVLHINELTLYGDSKLDFFPSLFTLQR